MLIRVFKLNAFIISTSTLVVGVNLFLFCISPKIVVYIKTLVISIPLGTNSTLNT